MAMEDKVNTILIVDDDEDFRRAARLVFEIEGFEVMEASNGAEAIADFKAHAPDLVVVDLRMPGMNGIDTLKELKHINESVPMIILTAYGTIPETVRAMQYGAVNFIEKTSPFNKLVELIKESIETSYKGNLSPREIEILGWVNKGKSNQEIGDNLHITESTVKAHLKHVYKKLNIASRTEAVHVAMRLGIIRSDKR